MVSRLSNIWKLDPRRSLTPIFLACAAAIQAGQVPATGTYDFSRVGLGSERTAVVVLAAECPTCAEWVPFLKQLQGMDRMDGKRQRLIVFALDGVWPVKDVLDKHGLKPHRLISYPMSTQLPVVEAPGLIIYDGDGQVLGKWVGQMTAEVKAAALAVLESKGY